MQVLKKILSLTLACALTLSMGAVTAFAATPATAKTEAELVAALAAASAGDTITLTAGFPLTATLLIREDVTIDGGTEGVILDASKITTGYPTVDNKHGVVVENATVTLNNLTIKEAGGYGIQIAAFQEADTHTLTLDNVTVAGSKKGGILVNQKGTTTNISTSTFTNNAWGDIQVVKGCTLDVNGTTFDTVVGKPTIWVDGATMSDMGAGKTVVTGDILGDYAPVAKGGNVNFVKKPTIAQTWTGDVPNTITATNKLYKQEADGEIVFENGEAFPATNISNATLTPNGYSDKILFNITVTPSTDVQLIAIDTDGKYYNVAKTKTWGPTGGFVPQDATTVFYPVATVAGDYEIKVDIVDMTDGTTVLNSEKWTLKVAEPKSDAKAITKFDIDAVEGAIDETTHTIAVEVAHDADVSALTPTIEVSAKASVTPASGTAHDFTNPVDYTVTAEDGSTQKYVVTVTMGKAPQSVAKAITKFDIGAVEGAIDEPTHTIAVKVAHGTDVKTLAPAIEVSAKASVAPLTGVVQDFTNPVDYTVTAEDGSTQKYVVTVTVGEAPSPVPVISVAVSPKTLDLAIGVSGISTGKLQATITPADATNKDVTWTSSNKNAATVDKNGVVTAVAAGTATITVTTVDGGKTATCDVAVTGKEDPKPDPDPDPKPDPDPDPKPDPDPDPKPDPKPTPDDKPSGGNTGGNNTANTPETTEKVKDTVDALKNPEAALPKDVVKTTTAGGATISTIPVAMTSGSANVGSSLFETLGSAPATVGLKLTVSNGMYGGSMEVIIPGGFGKITEPGRFSFPMDYSATAENSSRMLSAVKGDNAVNMTAKVGGNFTLPVTATVTVPTKLANGSTVNIYKYDPLTNKMISIGKAVVKDGKLTFATKMMGEMLFTTGTV